VIAKLAKFLLGISEPLKETFLMDVFDGSGADTGVKEGSITCSLAPTYTTDV
jgi:hypothetical protein